MTLDDMIATMPVDSDGERTCGSCMQRLAVSDFYSDGKDSDGNKKYRRDCKTCYNRARLQAKRKKKQEVIKPRRKRK